jgi:hypothetical protein
MARGAALVPDRGSRANSALFFAEEDTELSFCISYRVSYPTPRVISHARFDPKLRTIKPEVTHD